MNYSFSAPDFVVVSGLLFCELDAHAVAKSTVWREFSTRNVAHSARTPQEPIILLGFLGRTDAECQHKFVEFIVYKYQFSVNAAEPWKSLFPPPDGSRKNERRAMSPKRKRYRAHPQLGSVFIFA
jgi:hypothetical protein